MVYHEVRKIRGKKMNYLIQNQREGIKWVKKSRFVGAGKISKEKIKKLKEEFEIELRKNKKYKHLSKKQVEDIGVLKSSFCKSIDSLSSDEFAEFEKSLFTELIYNSNAIEGNSLSLEETSLILNENIVPEGKTLREIYEVRNHKTALEFLKDYTGDFNENLILKLHSIILKDISKRFAGKYRESSVRIFGSNVKFPDSEKVPQLIRNLIYWYKKNKRKYHPFEIAVLISMKFVTIHPFIDGNGRVSRLLMNFLLTKNNYPKIDIYMTQRNRYLKAVRRANEEDYSEIFPFLINALKENLKRFKII